MKKTVIAVTCLLVGCARPMTNPNATPEQAQRDQMECEYEATKAVPDTGVGSAMQIGFQRGQLLRQCMQLRGYR